MNLLGLDAPRVREYPFWGLPKCGHPDGCDQPATHQTQRPATEAEAEQHWAAVEQNIRASNSGHPEAEYVADRTDTVVIAEHRCDNPEHADPAYLEAKAREESNA